MEAKRLREKKYYYENREKILYKLRLKRLEKNPDLRNYNRKKPLKQYNLPERKKLRKRGGYWDEIKHHYPKNRRRFRDVVSDGCVV